MNAFQQLMKNKPHVFIPYFMLGFPTVEKSIELIKTAIDCGADALELGMPFSDPIADGPTICRASQTALENGMTFQKGLEIIKKIKQYKPIPIGLMTYYNLIYRAGSQVANDITQAGVDALLCVDILPEDFPAELDHLGKIFLIAPNTSEDRIKMIDKKVTAFNYVVARFGTTGARDNISPETLSRLNYLKTITTKPLVVGFGVSTPEHVKQLHAAGSNGVIIASQIINLIQKNEAEVKPFLQSCAVN